MINYELAKEVVETSDQNEVNTFLNLGWTLLGTASRSSDSEVSDPWIIYSLGWLKNEEPKRPDWYKLSLK